MLICNQKMAIDPLEVVKHHAVMFILKRLSDSVDVSNELRLKDYGQATFAFRFNDGRIEPFCRTDGDLGGARAESP